MTLREGYLHDSLAASLIGFLFALFAADQAVGGAAGDMVKFTGLFIVYALFFVVPGGFVAAYLNIRLHRVRENLGIEGLNAGFFTAIVYTIITLFTTLISAIQSKDPGTIFLGWVITVLFSFVFYPLGGTSVATWNKDRTLCPQSSACRECHGRLHLLHLLLQLSCVRPAENH